MRKIIATIIIITMTLTLVFANKNNSVNLTTYDLLQENIFYINGEGYIKNNGKLKKIEGTTFYSINGKRYINDNGKIKQIKENKIKKINGINYIYENNKLMTLDKYLELNNEKKEEKTFTDIFKLEKKDNIKLDYLSEYKLNNFKKNALNKVISRIQDKYPENFVSLKLLKEGQFNTKQIEIIRNFYFNLGDIELSKNINVLKNISQIDVKKLNYAIRKKLNNEKINFVNKNTDNIKLNFNFNSVVKFKSTKEKPTNKENKDKINEDEVTNTTDTSTETNDTTVDVEQEFVDLMSEIFGDL